MDSQDFERLTAPGGSHDEVTLDQRELSELALKAHAAEDTPGVPTENAAEIAALLGL